MTNKIKKTLEIDTKLDTSSLKVINEMIKDLSLSFSETGDTMKSQMMDASTAVSNSFKEMSQSMGVAVNSDEINGRMLGVITALENLILTVDNLSGNNSAGVFVGKITEMSDSIIGEFDSVSNSVVDIIRLSSKFGPFQDAFKKNEKAIETFVVTVKSVRTIVEIIELCKSISSTLGLVSTGANVASTAMTSLGVSASSIYMLLGGVVVGAIAALVVGVSEYSRGIDNNINRLKDKQDALKETEVAMENMATASKNAYESDTAQIDVQERYLDAILGNIDATGQFVGEKEKLAFWMGELNKSFPELNMSYDEETGKIATENGLLSENIGLVEDLIAAKRAQAYLDAYQDEYTQNLKNQKDNVEELSIAQSRYNELMAEKKLAEENQTAFDFSKYEEMGQLENYMSGLKDQIKESNEFIKEFESVGAMAANKDYEGANNLINGGAVTLFDPVKGEEQVVALKEQVGYIKSELDGLEQMKLENPEIGDAFDARIKALGENYQIATEQVELARLEFNSKFVETQEEDAIAQSTIYCENFETVSNEKMSGAGKTSMDKFRESSQEDLKLITYPEKEVIIRAKYLGFKDGECGPPQGQSSFDDTEPSFSVIRPRWMIQEGQSVFDEMQKGINPMQGIYSPIYNLGTSNGESASINQTVNFNQPVTTPSQTARAIRKVAQDIRKVK